MRSLIWLLAFVLLPSGCPTAAAQANRQEARDYYRKWIEQDAVYIITEEERDVFLKLNTDEERDQFIEQFWLRRDTDPRTPDNEFKEEHYRRVQYANQHYAAGIPGWKTDRGRVYIVFGKPDEIESYPSGGSYQRKAHEGGGWTSVFPFEIWYYRYIEGVGDGIELEFVNDAGGNLYRLTMDQQDKDALLHVPGMGLTDAEMYNPDFGGQKSFDRVNRIRESGLAYNQGINFERAKDQPFEKLELLKRISRPPPIRFTDLKEKVTARVTYSALPFRVAYDFIQLDSQTSIVPVTLSFNAADVSYQSEGELRQSRLQVYGQVSTLSGRYVFEFDDEIAVDFTERQAPMLGEHTYQRKLPLKPGRYKLDLMIKDAVSGKMGSTAIGLEIPAASEAGLATSSIMLSRGIEASDQDLADPYVFGSYKVRPKVDRIFGPEDNLGFYLEAYNFLLDQSTEQPLLEIKYGFAEPGTAPAAYRPISRGVTLAGDRVYLARILQLNGMGKGRHDLVLSIKDLLSGQTATARTTFEIR
ncbi:MAG: GWxTD domain-containing protein [Acidobacteriota bacterium]